MREVLEYHSTLEEGSLWVDYVSPKELYDRIVVLDPVEAAETGDGQAVRKRMVIETAQLMEDRQVKVYLTQARDSRCHERAREAVRRLGWSRSVSGDRIVVRSGEYVGLWDQRRI